MDKEIERLHGELAKWISHNGEMERLAAETLDGKSYKTLNYEQKQMANALMIRDAMFLDGNGYLFRK